MSSPELRPDPTESNTSHKPFERGSQRWSWKNIALASTLGAIILPAFALLGSKFVGVDFSVMTPEQTQATARVLIFQVAMGGSLGALLGYGKRKGYIR